MQRISTILLFGLACTLVSCVAGNGDPPPAAKNDRDPVPVYEAVLQQEIAQEPKDVDIYFGIDHKDPEPELLKKLQQRWPMLKAQSTRPEKGFVVGVGLSEFKWIDRNTATVRYSTSNGKDGRISRVRVVNKGGAWVIEKSDIEAIS
jgi:hypothetical protein